MAQSHRTQSSGPAEKTKLEPRPSPTHGDKATDRLPSLPRSSYDLDQALQRLSSHNTISIWTKSFKSLPSSEMQIC